MPFINRGNFNMKNKALKDKVNATKSLTTIDPFTFYSLDTFDSNELRKIEEKTLAIYCVSRISTK